MNKKLTPWFPAKVKPVRKGFYERDYGFGEEDIPDYWDGRKWWIVPNSCPLVRAAGTAIFPWRGLAKKP